MRCRGFTLIELLVTLAVVTTLLAAGVPAIAGLAQDARRTADINALVTSIQLARSESARRGAAVFICGTHDFESCGRRDVKFERGWLVVAAGDGNAEPRAGANDAVLFRYSPATDGTIRSNRPRYAFRPYSRRSTNGTITFCDARGESEARAVIVSYTGRPRVSGTGPGDRRLVCAD